MKQVRDDMWCRVALLSLSLCWWLFSIIRFTKVAGIRVAEVTWLRRVRGDLYANGAVESIKLSSALVVPHSSGRWGVWREPGLWMEPLSLSGKVLTRICRENQLVSLSMIGVQVQPCSAWSNLSGSCVVELNIAGTNVDDSTSGFLSTLTALDLKQANAASHFRPDGAREACAAAHFSVA